MFRFTANSKTGDSFDLSKETLKHIKVARTSEKEFVVIFQEKFYKCKLVGESAQIIEELNEDHEHNGEVIIAASFINTKRFEWLIQKATELGATKLIPVLSRNVSNKLNGDIEKKVSRWNDIARNASEQSFRNKSMEVTSPMKFKEALKIDVSNKYIAYVLEGSEVKTSFPTDSIFFIGPEGGYSKDEVDLATSNGVEIISLGKRILRAETASIFCLARVNSI